MVWVCRDMLRIFMSSSMRCRNGLICSVIAVLLSIELHERCDPDRGSDDDCSRGSDPPTD
jgi:hypothetical protein